MKITRVFFNTYMGYGFEGLRQITKDAKTPITEDTTIVFINRPMTAFKYLRGPHYLVYYKNGGRRIPLDALALLPTFFGGSQTEMDQAIKKSLVKKLNLEG
jgi:hypothetical protein